MLNVVILRVVMPSVVMLRVVILSVVMLNVVMLSVVAPVTMPTGWVSSWLYCKIIEWPKKKT